MQTQSSKTSFALDRARFDAVVAIAEPIARAHGAEIVDVEFKTEQGGWVLRVFVEKVGASSQRMSTKDAAVNLELCSNVARELSPALDVADMIPHRYHLEVSSPGVERPIKKRDDVARFAGEKAKFWLAVPCAGQKVVVGKIVGVTPEEGQDIVSILDGSRTFSFAWNDVERARLVFELASNGKSSHKNHSSSKPKKHQ